MDLSRYKLRNDLIALLLFGVVTGMRFLTDSQEIPWSMLYVLPIGLLAVTHGLAGGIAGFFAATALFGLWSHFNSPVPLEGWILRLVTWGSVGIGFGLLERVRSSAYARAEGWFDLSNDLLAELDPEGRFVRVNRQWTELLGHPAGNLLGHRYIEFVHPDDVEASLRMEESLVGSDLEMFGFENRFIATDGSWHWMLWSIRVRDNETFASGKDITERKLSEQDREARLSVERNAARSDGLTGLPNRRAWEEELEKEQARSRAGRSDLGIAILDLDHFKVLNDTKGHAAGDEYLRLCAKKWSAALRSTDFLARVGGEEFGVLMPRCSQHVAMRVVERIRVQTPPPQTCSAGVALHEDSEPIAETVARADRALYRAKSEGRDQTAFEPARELGEDSEGRVPA